MQFRFNDRAFLHELSRLLRAALERGDGGLALGEAFVQAIDDIAGGLFVADREGRTTGVRREGGGH